MRIWNHKGIAVWAGLVVLLGAWKVSASNELVLIHDGKPNATIVTPSPPAPEAD